MANKRANLTPFIVGLLPDLSKASTPEEVDAALEPLRQLVGELKGKGTDEAR